MNIDQDRHMLMVDDNVGNLFRENAVQNVGHLDGQNAVQNQAARAEGNANGNNGNQIRCYNCQEEDHLACNCIVKPGKQDTAYLQKQMQIALKEEAGIQLTQEEFDFMANAGAYEEIERVNANCTLKDNLQQASTSCTQTDKAPVYDSDKSAEVHHSEFFYDNDIFNMFTQEEQYTELLEPIPESHQVPQNDSNVISDVSSVEQSRGTVEQHPATPEETRALYDQLYNNLATEVEKVNSVNRKLRETNADLTTELARYKNQEKCFEISQEKHDKLERCYQKSVYQEKCLPKKINALHLSSVVSKSSAVTTADASDKRHQQQDSTSSTSTLATTITADGNFDLGLSVASKENGVNILKSIDEGPFRMGTFQEILAEGIEGALHLGLEQARVYSNLLPDDKDRYNADIRATNILLQGLPKDIYTLINHYTDAKDIWDNVKMLLEGSELTKEDRESQLYDDFEHFCQNKEETIHDYYVRFTKLINNMRNIKMTMSKMQLNSKFVNNMLLEWGRFVMAVKPNRGLKESNYDQLKNGVVLDEEQLLFLASGHNTAIDEDVDEPLIQDLALNVDNVFQADECDAFDSDVDEAPTAQTMFMANLSSADPVYDEAGPSYDLDIQSELHDHDNYQDAVCEHHEVHEMHDDIQPNCIVDSDAEYTGDSNMILYDQYVKDNAEPVDVLKIKAKALKEQTKASRPIKALMVYPPNTPATLVPRALTKEIKEMKEIFKELEAEVDQNVMNRKYDVIERKNLFIANDNLIADCLSKEVFYIPTNSELTVSRFTKMHDAHTILQARCLELEAELSKLNDKVQKDDHTELVKHFFNLEETRSEVDRTLYFRALDFQITHLTEKVTILQEQNELFRAENAKLKQHYKELYDSIKITRAKHIEQTTALLTENKNLKVQINEKMKCVTMDSVKPKVLAPGMYAIDVGPIPPRCRNNREVHLDYLKHLMESVETLREIVEEARVVHIILWYLDSGCSKHMTEDRLRLRNFMKKFIRTVRFGNDHFGAIMGYGDYVISDSVISMVYYVEGLGHNLFSVRQFCDFDLEVAFRKHSCYVRDTDGVDLIKGSRGSNLYTISVEDTMKSSPICLLSKASKNKSWLWHRRLNHLNFGTINVLARKDLVRGLPRLKFKKHHFCSACQLGKSKKHTHTPKTEKTNLEVLNTLHMDLCGPMRVQTINGKKYILVIIDDYSRFTWVMFLRSKDETLEFVIKFLKQIQVGLNKTIRYIRTDNGTEFVNQVLTKYYESVGIFHQKSVLRTPQ
ncbi:retrovirus-related pol polyprotein from transposon TNT 1-94 [Tanacetum coccineum]|uniref:Retrovirus-related pol polyprotein from transposon TNT 1-94 n=1 Tax=Tanacetum coccineum TaxID=301880 RepID=A0ABQ5D1I1_9ASTR